MHLIQVRWASEEAAISTAEILKQQDWGTAYLVVQTVFTNETTSPKKVGDCPKIIQDQQIQPYEITIGSATLFSTIFWNRALIPVMWSLLPYQVAAENTEAQKEDPGDPIS